MLRGKVKWFDARKGYGFITDEAGKDYFVHFTAIQMEGYRTLTEGEPVAFEAEETPRGPQATRVIRLEESGNP